MNIPNHYDTRLIKIRVLLSDGIFLNFQCLFHLCLKCSSFNFDWPGFAMLARIASACFFFHFFISFSICSFLSGLSDHRHPFRCEAPWGRSSLQNALLSDKLCLTEFCELNRNGSHESSELVVSKRFGNIESMFALVELFLWNNCTQINNELFFNLNSWVNNNYLIFTKIQTKSPSLVKITQIDTTSLDLANCGQLWQNLSQMV